MLVCKCEPCDHASPKSRNAPYVSWMMGCTSMCVCVTGLRGRLTGLRGGGREQGTRAGTRVRVTGTLPRKRAILIAICAI
eukprot:2269443-Prymnesium_polylepis.1